MRPRIILDLSISAGLGGAFGVILALAAIRFVYTLTCQERFDEILAVTLVAVGLWKVLEPLTDRAREALSIAELRAVEGAKTRFFQLKIFAILVFTSLAHGLLHSIIHPDPQGSSRWVLWSLVGSAAITFGWLWGASRTPPRAAMFGLVAPVITNGFFLAVFLHHPRLWAVPELRAFWIARIAPKVALGLVGGLVIDKGWASRPSRFIVLVILVCNVGFSLLALGLVPKLFTLFIALGSLGEALGWGSVIMIHPTTDSLLSIPSFARPSPPPIPTIPIS